MGRPSPAMKPTKENSIEPTMQSQKSPNIPCHDQAYARTLRTYERSHLPLLPGSVPEVQEGSLRTGADNRCHYRGTDDWGIDIFPSIAAGDGQTKAQDYGDSHDETGTTQAQTGAPATETRGASKACSETRAQTTYTKADSTSGGTSSATAPTAARQKGRTAGASIHAAGNTARATTATRTKSGSAPVGHRHLRGHAACAGTGQCPRAGFRPDDACKRHCYDFLSPDAVRASALCAGCPEQWNRRHRSRRLEGRGGHQLPTIYPENAPTSHDVRCVGASLRPR